MSLRIGVDLDGTLADLSARFHDQEELLFGERSTQDAEPTAEEPSEKDLLKTARAASRQHDAVWRALRSTENMWMQLKPIEPAAVRRLYEAMVGRDWEVFFITQRPTTCGLSVQAQTQKWLIEQGFETPSVLTLSGPRGKVAQVLDLDFLIDDLPKNCVDVISDSSCRPLLLLRKHDASAEQAAKRLGIGVIRSISEGISLLSEPAAAPRTTMLDGVLRRLGLV